MSRRRSRALRIALVLLLGVPLVCEAAFRLLEPHVGVDRARIRGLRDFIARGELAQFEPRVYTVFQRPRREPFNSAGFSDVEWSVAKEPGVPRILCLGSSTTEGGNGAGREGSYPRFLERALEARTGRDFEVLNAGISGWTSAEVLVSWLLLLQDLAPDLVVIHEGVNDLLPRFRADFLPDYSHWRVSYAGTRASALERVLAQSDLYLYLRLLRAGVPDIQTLTRSEPSLFEPAMQSGRLPPASAAAFRRNVADIAASARSLGAAVALMTVPWNPASDIDPVWPYGLAEHNQLLIELAREHDYLLVDAARVFAERETEVQPEFLDFVHVTPRGNELKAELVAQALSASWKPALSPAGTGSPVPESTR